MKITILFASLADYSVAFFRQLAMQNGWRIQLVYQPAKIEAPYSAFDLTFCEEAIEDTASGRLDLLDRVLKFGAPCLLMCSWNFSHFMKIAGTLRRRGVYVVSAMDNQWHGTAKQWLGVITSPIHLKPNIDTFLVAGDRQAQFARRLGYPDVMYGYYAADIERFARPAGSSKDLQRRFLFVGRLVEDKGVDILLHAYKRYRALAGRPWGLMIAGTGALKPLLQDVPGVEYRGFVQPSALPSLMHEATAFVLPSRFEPWGVVIHEAAAAGLPIICTSACGASTYFVRDGVNGFIVSGGAELLAQAMERLSNATESRRNEMQDASLRLASLWQPSMLARYFTESVRDRIARASAMGQAPVSASATKSRAHE